MPDADGDSTLVCGRCRFTTSVRFAEILREGPPNHCGVAMTLADTTADVDAAVAEVLGPARDVARRYRSLFTEH